jgi:hypothetical protein
MNISSISGSSLSNSNVSSSSSNNATSPLEAKLKSLNADLQKEKSSNDDEKTKSAKVAKIGKQKRVYR